MNRELRQQILAYLHNHNAMTLATVGPEAAWAAGLFYVNDGFDLYWLSDLETRHSGNLAYNPNVAVAIHEDYRDWRVIQGIQMEGAAEQVGTVAQATGPMKLFLGKFPFLTEAGHPPLALAKALATTRVYRFTPTRVYFIDNTKGLGHRDELDPSVFSERQSVPCGST